MSAKRDPHAAVDVAARVQVPPIDEQPAGDGVVVELYQLDPEVARERALQRVGGDADCDVGIAGHGAAVYAAAVAAVFEDRVQPGGLASGSRVEAVAR